jgi:hypothetical protein
VTSKAVENTADAASPVQDSDSGARLPRGDLCASSTLRSGTSAISVIYTYSGLRKM